MEIRYDFVNSLDLTYFRKQAVTFLGKVDYYIFVPGFRIEIYPEDEYLIISIYDLEKDANGNIVKENLINPLTNYRFDNFKLKEKFSQNGFSYVSLMIIHNNKIYFLDEICDIIKFFYKIHKLKAFL